MSLFYTLNVVADSVSLSLLYTFNVAAVVCLSFTLLMLQFILSLLYTFNVAGVVCLSVSDIHF
jgi:hypothetical protein